MREQMGVVMRSAVCTEQRYPGLQGTETAAWGVSTPAWAAGTNRGHAASLGQAVCRGLASELPWEFHSQGEMGMRP